MNNFLKPLNIYVWENLNYFFQGEGQNKQQLRALAGDLGSIPPIHMAATTICNSSSRKSKALF